MARLVLTDASPLIGLARVDGLNWLGALFGVVWMPVEVRREVLAGLVRATRHRFKRPKWPACFAYGHHLHRHSPICPTWTRGNRRASESV